MTIAILGVVLSGGQAQRMEGRSKGLMLFNDHPLCQYATSALMSTCDKVMINANKDNSYYQAMGFEVFCDDLLYLDKGPLSGVYTALSIARDSGFSHVMISPCDTPNVDASVFEMLKQQSDSSPNTLFFMRNVSGAQPLHAIIPVENYFSTLSVFLKKESKVMHFYELCNAESVYYTEEVFLNINYLSQLTL